VGETEDALAEEELGRDEAAAALLAGVCTHPAGYLCEQVSVVEALPSLQLVGTQGLLVRQR
jgi:hypothetical protein